MSSTTKLCIWHKGCMDGFGAAWSVIRAYGEDDVELFGGVYEQPAPTDADVHGRDVYIVDFSYDEATLRRLAAAAESVTIIDHHKTAQATIETLLSEGVVKGCFAMDKSGALLAYEWFFPHEEVPALIQHISDRDLWLYELEGTREVCAAMYSYPMDYRVWCDLMALPITELIVQGGAIDRDHLKKVTTHVNNAATQVDICGYTVPALNAPPSWSSDAGNIMCKGHPFAVTYYIDNGGINVSLRSDKATGIDVSDIARAFGGGGHRNAAGFRLVDLSELADTQPLPALQETPQ